MIHKQPENTVGSCREPGQLDGGHIKQQGCDTEMQAIVQLAVCVWVLEGQLAE